MGHRLRSFGRSRVFFLTVSGVVCPAGSSPRNLAGAWRSCSGNTGEAEHFMSLAEPKTAVVSSESPWLGLRPFTEGVREYFFGRDAEVRDLFQRVVHKPLTVLFGRSGLGKTSLLQAALVPRLRDAGFLPIVLRLDYADGTASLLRQFVDALVAALTPVLPGLDASLTRLPANARLHWLLFHDPVFGLTAPEAPRPVVLLDQFEEIFTMSQAMSERQAAATEFLEMLADLVENRVPESLRSLLEADDALADRLDYAARPAKVLLSVREDFLHLLERYRGRMPALMDNRFELRLLTGPQALEAVIEPGRLRCRPRHRPRTSRLRGNGWRDRSVRGRRQARYSTRRNRRCPAVAEPALRRVERTAIGSRRKRHPAWAARRTRRRHPQGLLRAVF